jgi:hypothetical protein
MAEDYNIGVLAAPSDCTGSAEYTQVGRGLRILLTDTKRWAVGVRIGMVFARMGCEVAMLCATEGHPAYTVESIRHRFAYDGFSPLASLRESIVQFRPDLVLPTCDRGAQHLFRLYREASTRGERDIVDCIERSLGPADSFPIVSNRYALLKLADAEGIRVPETISLRDRSDLAAAEQSGFPLVIKADGTWGGCGVKVARDREELASAYDSLRGRRGVVWLAKELALNRDRGNTLHDWRNTRPALIAQSYVGGRPANCAVACWQGKILAGIAVEVIATNGELGPASMIEVVEGREMLQAAERIARRLNLSGFFGLDFIIERGTGAAWLIEMNARCTQLCSMAMGKGRNLPAAMCAQLAGKPEPASEPLTPLGRIKYFPSPSHPVTLGLDVPVASYYYDVPVNENEFVHLLMNPWAERSKAGQWLDRVRSKRRGTAKAAGAAPVQLRSRLQALRARLANPAQRKHSQVGAD